MTSNACPFCGLVTDAPHETQQGCIDALHAEIARVREILELARPTSDTPPPSSELDGRP
jgi:hypothetical protein